MTTSRKWIIGHTRIDEKKILHNIVNFFSSRAKRAKCIAITGLSKVVKPLKRTLERSISVERPSLMDHFVKRIFTSKKTIFLILKSIIEKLIFALFSLLNV
ncbi:uncharacterized protein BYT42DRAFT_586797 [Radiomyces spectabilis]|uniref:uncharacterized protein n=1 Tax=Radiomyces spectabilis TaxID=64574 RepID=UPI00221FC058|nr:uncharacterized protein BYT42DRAFT_586797 [Radiomyces spectabilis]KAI8367584.1 hypothetical protein BYT42DRAFT_586797 [Radiomyces spectabilis]